MMGNSTGSVNGESGVNMLKSLSTYVDNDPVYPFGTIRNQVGFVERIW